MNKYSISLNNFGDYDPAEHHNYNLKIGFRNTYYIGVLDFIVVEGFNNTVPFNVEKILSIYFEESEINSTLTYNVTVNYYDDNTEQVVTVTYSLSDFTDYVIGGSDLTIFSKIFDNANEIPYQYFLIGTENLVVRSNFILCYPLENERNVVNKYLDADSEMLIKGSFKNTVSVKSPVIDIENFFDTSYQRTKFNYVYIQPLNRYYYVQSVELVTNKIARLYLQEDVLMSFKDLIKDQTAFISRNENDYDLDIVDDYVQYDYDKEIRYSTFIPDVKIFPDKQTKEGANYDPFAEDDRKSIFLITVIG